jgi:hypothetical protein
MMEPQSDYAAWGYSANFYDGFFQLIYSNPRALFACLAGLLVAWAITQRVKFWSPRTWSSKAREIATQATAFFSGLIVTTALWRGATDGAFDAPTAGLIVGLLAPALWNLAMFIVGLWKPELAKRLSQDKDNP